MNPRRISFHCVGIRQFSLVETAGISGYQFMFIRYDVSGYAHLFGQQSGEGRLDVCLYCSFMNEIGTGYEESGIFACRNCQYQWLGIHVYSI